MAAAFLTLCFLGLCRFSAVVGLAVVSVLRRRPRHMGPVPRTTVVIPAHDEAYSITDCLRSVALLNPPPAQVLVVDDGSTDGTSDVALAAAARFGLTVRVLRQPWTGKAAALNLGLREATGEVVLTVDADTRLHPEALGELASALGPGVVAACANVRVAPECRGWLAGWQRIEYLTALNLERRAQSVLGCITTVPGAAAAYDRMALERAGGFSDRTVTEDTDITLTLQAVGGEVAFVDRAIAWTLVPRSFAALFRQRRRWIRGNLQCAWVHRRLLGSLRRPRLGWLGLPNLWFSYLAGPVLFFFGAACLPFVMGAFTTELTFQGLAVLGGMDLLAAALAISLDRSGMRALAHAPLQRALFPFFLLGVLASLPVGRRRAAARW